VSDQTDSDVGDIFAGCFLSLAGSLVGSVVGAVSVFLLNFPEVGIGQAILRFGVGFAAGVVVGFIATFVIGALARLIARGHAENFWIGGVAVSAATGAAVTAWRLFPV
jgi:hypothetical protein